MSGEVLGVDIAESGGGLGGEVGVALVRGSAEVRLTASMDGLAAGLGAVPFPDRAVRASLGWRF
ncbi:MAG TPA: hypothetical protein VK966_03070 [Longimicrobiales bacterium]|nr:hypothetical protein [Longimicrobiales bacterium]